MSIHSDGFLDFEGENSDGLAQWRASVELEKRDETQELNFATGSDQLAVWRQEQSEKLHAIARREGLPIGETVRIVLQSDLELTGRLLLDWENEQLQIGRVNFSKSEIVSCIRVEE